MPNRQELSFEERAAIRRVLEEAKFELIPLKGVLDQAAHLPNGATVSVTASPAKGMDATLDLAAELQQRGFNVIPHVSARLVRDRDHLKAILTRLKNAELSRIFLVAGDASDHGEFFDAYSLLLAMEEMGHHLTEIGVTAYPDGHPLIPDDKLAAALHDKQPHAAYMTTQMCFDADAITGWLDRARDSGIRLPVHLGLPGAADRLRLIQISARIGVGQSVRFLSKHRGLVSRFIRRGGYAPHELLEVLAPTLADPSAAIEGTHIYTFNQCDSTEEWRQAYLSEL